MEDKKTISATVDWLLLPTDLIRNEIGAYLTNLKDKHSFSMTCGPLHKLFEKDIAKRLLPRLLKLVASNELDKVEEMLKVNAAVLPLKGSITDSAGRIFEDITAFQLALWYVNPEAFQLIHQYLQPEEASKQMREHVYEETEYKKMNGNYYDALAFIDALEAYISTSNRWFKVQSIWNQSQRKSLYKLKDIKDKMPKHLQCKLLHWEDLLAGKRAYDGNEIKLSNILMMSTQPLGPSIPAFLIYAGVFDLLKLEPAYLLTRCEAIAVQEEVIHMIKRDLEAYVQLKEDLHVSVEAQTESVLDAKR